MVEYRKVLVPIDGSDHSIQALEHGVKLAQAFGAELLLLNVANVVSAIANFDQTPISGGYVSEQLAEELEASGRELLAETVKLVPEGVKVSTVLEVGSPGPVVISTAKENDVDLIVMGSRGLGVLKRIFMGSVSSYVASHDTCPVLIVK